MDECHHDELCSSHHGACHLPPRRPFTPSSLHFKHAQQSSYLFARSAMRNALSPAVSLSLKCIFFYGTISTKHKDRSRRGTRPTDALRPKEKRGGYVVIHAWTRSLFWSLLSLAGLSRVSMFDVTMHGMASLQDDCPKTKRVARPSAHHLAIGICVFK